MWITSVNNKQWEKSMILPICRADEKTAIYYGVSVVTVKQIRWESRQRNYAVLKPYIIDKVHMFPPQHCSAKVKAFLLSNRQVPHKFSKSCYRTSWSSRYHSCFVFGKPRVQISAQRSAILTEVFRGFPQSFQANAGIVP
jgi:hypothetical protein